MSLGINHLIYSSQSKGCWWPRTVRTHIVKYNKHDWQQYLGPYTSLQPITCSGAQVRIRSQPPVVNRKDCVNKSSSDLSVLRSSLNFTATTSQQSSKTPAPVELCPATQCRSEEVISSWGPEIQMPCVSVCDCRLCITDTPVSPNLDSKRGKKHYFLQEKLEWPKPSDPDISLVPF